jgi:murein tripeptide amidase MpaA
VLCVRNAMDETGVRFALDVHGDESIPYNFIAGFEGVAAATERQFAGLQRYKAALAAVSPDFQTAVGYPAAPAGRANLTMSTNQLAHRFGAVSATLEMPFKDTEATPDDAEGWSPDRSAHLGRACLRALHMILPEL